MLIFFYILSVILLILHEIESAYEKEWEILKLPGKITCFILLHIPILLIFFYGLYCIIQYPQTKIIISLLIGTASFIPFLVHKVIVNKKEHFNQLISNVLIYGNIISGVMLIILGIYSGMSDERYLDKVDKQTINNYNKHNMNNMNTIAYFEIQSSNPEREVAFYKAVFGWNFVKDESLPIEYYRIETACMSGGLLERPAAVPPLECGTNAFTCSIQVENFDETSKRILEAGGRIALPKFAIPGQSWHGYFIDMDNNTFGVFEMDSNAK